MFAPDKIVIQCDYCGNRRSVRVADLLLPGHPDVPKWFTHTSPTRVVHACSPECEAYVKKMITRRKSTPPPE